MNVRQACSREVYIVRPHEPLVGILTDRDIVAALPERAEALEPTLVGEHMSADLLTPTEDESIVDAMTRLRQRGVRRAPVVAPNGELVGIVSTDDLLGIVAEQLSSLARLVERQARRH